MIKNLFTSIILLVLCSSVIANVAVNPQDDDEETSSSSSSSPPLGGGKFGIEECEAQLLISSNQIAALTLELAKHKRERKALKAIMKETMDLILKNMYSNDDADDDDDANDDV